MPEPKVAILMGSSSDLDIAREAAAKLKELGIPYEMKVMSAHRTPDMVAEYSKTARSRGLAVIIAVAKA